ncbi:IS3 family transposase, partial [Streptomyces sp. NPDC059153]|uniref:IS3 family transposase n=1 Tax=Streptomyces sp. NPDC059153 TaxID=3346743 RepID=UPI0036CF04E4
WLAGAEARATRQREDRILAEEIREVHGESGGAYGSPRATAELREKGSLLRPLSGTPVTPATSRRSAITRLRPGRRRSASRMQRARTLPDEPSPNDLGEN